MRNLIPGQQIDCYGENAIFRVDCTMLSADKHSAGLPTVNLAVMKGERNRNGAGILLIDSPMNTNTQLSEFELIEFGCFLLGYRHQFRVSRPLSYTEIIRQADPTTGMAKLFVRNKITNERSGLALPIPAQRFFFITTLVMKQISALSGNLPVELIKTCMEGMMHSPAPSMPQISPPNHP